MEIAEGLEKNEEPLPLNLVQEKASKNSKSEKAPVTENIQAEAEKIFGETNCKFYHGKLPRFNIVFDEKSTQGRADPENHKFT